MSLADPHIESLVIGVPPTLKVSIDGITNGWINTSHTCDGEDKPPTIVVERVPKNARAVALVMYDPDAPIGTFIHWLAIAQASGQAVIFPGQAKVEGRNDFRRIGYGGPCPPKRHGPHRYFFLALALDRDPGLKRGFTLTDFENAVRGRIVAWGYSMGRYERKR